MTTLMTLNDLFDVAFNYPSYAYVCIALVLLLLTFVGVVYATNSLHIIVPGTIFVAMFLVTVNPFITLAFVSAFAFTKVVERIFNPPVKAKSKVKTNKWVH